MALVALLLVIIGTWLVASNAALTDIRASCSVIQPRYNIATQKNASIICNLNVVSLPDYVWASVFIIPCYPVWDDIFGVCLPAKSCQVGWEEGTAPQSTVCNITVPAMQSMLGDFNATLYYFNKHSRDAPAYTKVLGSFSVVSDPSFQCPPGYAYQKNSYCEPCGKGTFSINGNECDPCPLGTVGTLVGATNCTPCEPGYYGGGGSTACVKAAAGYMAPGGTDNVFPCAPGTFAAASKSIECTSCPTGTYSGAKATKCTACAAGKVSGRGAHTCISCLPGTFAPAGSSSCTPCPANTYSKTFGAVSDAACIACPVGTNLRANCSHSSLCCV